MSSAQKDDKLMEFVRSLEEASNFLAYSAEKAEVSDSEYYLALRNYIQAMMKEIKTKN